MNFAERRPFGRQSPPAFAHQVVDIARTMLRSRQRNAWRCAGDGPLCETLKVINNGFVTELLIRALSGQHEDLPQSHGERPYVTFGRIFPLFNRWELFVYFNSLLQLKTTEKSCYYCCTWITDSQAIQRTGKPSNWSSER